MFTSAVRGGKAFAAEQKIRELKTRYANKDNIKFCTKHEQYEK